MFLATYNPKTLGSWKVFTNEVKKLEKTIGPASLIRHFKGRTQRGKEYLPHFSSSSIIEATSNSEIIAQSLDNMEKAIEARGLRIIEKKLSEIEDGKADMNVSQVINFLGKLQTGFASKRIYELKKSELSDKNRRFNKVLLAGLYGGKIREAELANDNTGNDEGDVEIRAIDAPSENNERPE